MVREEIAYFLVVMCFRSTVCFVLLCFVLISREKPVQNVLLFW